MAKTYVFVVFSLLNLIALHGLTNAGLCGNRQYNDRTELCCCSRPSSCRVYRLTESLTCCGHYAANTNLGEYCCGFNRDRICRQITTGDGKCGGRTYNHRAEVCCDGVIRSVVTGTFCCGKKNYSPRWGKCCGGVINDVVTGTFCCGTKNFRTGYECCDPITEKIRVGGRC